jgi:hypothetical protein
MAQSQELASETQAMRKIEAAFEYAQGLPQRQLKRVLRWAREEYLDKAPPADTETSEEK